MRDRFILTPQIMRVPDVFKINKTNQMKTTRRQTTKRKDKKKRREEICVYEKNIRC